MAVDDYGRQYGNIRRDHVARYEWVRGSLPAGLTVLDVGCGTGYGCEILAARRDLSIVGMDKIDLERTSALWRFVQVDLETADELPMTDFAVCFEVIEHLENPVELLRRIPSFRLICSVPNQDVVPFDPARQKFHKRHYTPAEFVALLALAGWRVVARFGQLNKESNVVPLDSIPGELAMTLIFECRRSGTRD